MIPIITCGIIILRLYLLQRVPEPKQSAKFFDFERCLMDMFRRYLRHVGQDDMKMTPDLTRTVKRMVQHWAIVLTMVRSVFDYP